MVRRHPHLRLGVAGGSDAAGQLTTPIPAPWRRRCTLCGGYIGRDRPITATTCSCHGEDSEYNPRHDKHLDERVLAILMHAAHSGPVNICRMLGTEDRDAIRHAVDRLRKQGWRIRGSRGHGYVME